MRSVILLAFFASAALAGCATPMPAGDASSEMQKLQDECTARGGILKPIPGAHSPDDRANYACEITGVSK